MRQATDPVIPACTRFLANRRGTSLVETVVATGLFTLLLLGGLSLFVGGTNSWNSEFQQGSQETDTRQAMRRIEDTLRPACQVVVDSDGMGLTYYYPVRGADGRPVLPVASDGEVRRIAVDSTGDQVVMSGRNRPLVRDLAADGPVFALRDSGRAVLVTLNVSTTDGRRVFSTTKSQVIALRNAL